MKIIINIIIKTNHRYFYDQKLRKIELTITEPFVFKYSVVLFVTDVDCSVEVDGDESVSS